MAVWQWDCKAGSGQRVLASGSLCTCGRCDCEGLRGSEFLSPLSPGRIRPRSPRTYSMKSLTRSLLPRRWAGRGGAEQSSPGTKGAARSGGEGRGGGSGGGGWSVMSPALTGGAGSETPPPTEPNPTRPDPPPSSDSGCPRLEGRRHRAPSRPQSPHHHGRRNDGPSVSQRHPPNLPPPPTPGPLAPRRPRSRDP